MGKLGIGRNLFEERGFFDSLTIRDDRQNARKYLTLRYVVKTRFIPPISL